MKAHRADFPIRAMCRVLELSSSGYYDWLKRRPSARAIEDERLGAKIRESGWTAARRMGARGFTRRCGQQASRWVHGGLRG